MNVQETTTGSSCMPAENECVGSSLSVSRLAVFKIVNIDSTLTEGLRKAAVLFFLQRGMISDLITNPASDPTNWPRCLWLHFIGILHPLKNNFT